MNVCWVSTAAKKRADYAKFELDSPPLVLSLEPRSPGVHGSLNHVGFRFADDSGTGGRASARLEQAGIRTEREEGVECCYAKQTKFWVNDLDHRLWEFYVLEDDIDHRGAGQKMEVMGGVDVLPCHLESAHQPVVYEHFMGMPFALPPKVPCDEIRLRGTFNVPLSDGELKQKTGADPAVPEAGWKDPSASIDVRTRWYPTRHLLFPAELLS